MIRSTNAEFRRGIILTLIVPLIIAAIIILPFQFRSEAGSPDKKLSEHRENLPNYDIRNDKSAFEKMASFRGFQNRNATDIADVRDKFAQGEKALRVKVPALKIEYNLDLRTPEVIAPDVAQGRNFLTGPSGAKRSDVLKHFLKQNSDLAGASDDQISGLKISSDYSNPDGNLSFLKLEQEVNGIPVFRGEVKAGFTKNGEIIRVINNLAPGLEYGSLSTDFREPADAVRAAAAFINHNLKADDTARNSAASSDLKVIFGQGDRATTAEKMYFPTEPGVAVPAWRVLIWQAVNAYYVIVDAETGTMLWRKNITEDQTQAATYLVYANPNAMVNIAHNPFPMSPGTLSPNGIQAAGIPRTSITRIGNESPYTFNNLGWINDGGNNTDGNNVQAGLDRESPNASSPANPSDIDSNGMATGSPDRVFAYGINPGTPTNPAQNTGDEPLPSGQMAAVCQAAGTATPPTAYQQAVTTQLFYIANVYHDEMYLLGFNEQAGNFQHNNFGRGGVGNDRLSAQAQDCYEANAANFSTPADGTRPQMQMALWTAPTPDFDASLDADIVIHEMTHGTSNRLHGNSTGLVMDMARAMGEGWSDFYAQSMLSGPDDPINGVYPFATYITYRRNGVGFNNNYYGIRRFPKAVMSFTGGPSGRPHNPLTFADIDVTQLNVSDGAFAPASNFGSADQIHNAGEIWSSALWEIRARMIGRLGWAVGNRRVLQLVTDGMKLAPLGPTFLTERDAILAAGLASGTAADVADIWDGFAIRGMGMGASIQHNGGLSLGGTGTDTTRVTESFNTPNLLQTPAFTVSDQTGDNDGFAEPGEPLTLTVPLTNFSGTNASGVSLQLDGGGSASYGTINHAATVTRQISFTIPAGTPCGSAVTLTFNVNSSLGSTTFTRSILIGAPSTTFTENFDGVTAPALPSGWTTSSVAGGINFFTSTSAADSPPNAVFALEPSSVGGSSDLTSPVVRVNSSAATVSFRNNYDTERGWDGGVLEISIAGASFQDIIAAGGTFLQNGYNDRLGDTTSNPLAGRQAWAGNSGGYITTTAQLPSTANGKNVQLRWRFGADNNTALTGWYIDTVQILDSYSCSYSPGSGGDVKSRADFDGDGKSDLSVFRASQGTWYLKPSTGGITVLRWGEDGDQPVASDYDGDGKADAAIFRPTPGDGPDFYILNSTDYTVGRISWGEPGDVPVVGDYDGDEKADAALFRPSNNTWYIRKSTGGLTITTFGAGGDLPVQGDYDGDGRTDIAIYRAGQWWISKSGGGLIVSNWGEPADRPVPADYDGDGTDDIAVFRPSNGFWYIRRSSTGQFDFISWGQNGDLPVPGDYDGDGRDDPSVYRNGTWYLNQSSAGFAVSTWGVTTDVPVPSEYIP